jgi:hypothetical protein
MFTVEKNITFNSSLLSILTYIAKDSPTNARKFKTQLDKTFPICLLKQENHFILIMNIQEI